MHCPWAGSSTKAQSWAPRGVPLCPAPSPPDLAFRLLSPGGFRTCTVDTLVTSAISSPVSYAFQSDCVASPKDMTPCLALLGFRTGGLCPGQQGQRPVSASPPPSCSSHILAAPKRTTVERSKWSVALGSRQWRSSCWALGWALPSSKCERLKEVFC